MTTKAQIETRLQRIESQRNQQNHVIFVDTEEDFKRYQNYPGVVIYDDIPAI